MKLCMHASLRGTRMRMGHDTAISNAVNAEMSVVDGAQGAHRRRDRHRPGQNRRLHTPLLPVLTLTTQVTGISTVSIRNRLARFPLTLPGCWLKLGLSILEIGKFPVAVPDGCLLRS